MSDQRANKRLKPVILLATAVLGALTMLAWTQNWYTVQVAGEPIEVGGDVAAPALAALALSGLALAGAAAIASIVLRFVLGGLQVLIGGTIALEAILAINDPVAAVAAAITAATGVSGDGVGSLAESISGTAWPWVTLFLGLLSIAAGFAILLTARLWPRATRKYQATRFEDSGANGSPVGDWDALSEGDDPTSR
jgi:Tryptophan-associated transmembrane protein (Trp_oprn_chp)